jgi:protein TonB
MSSSGFGARLPAMHASGLRRRQVPSVTLSLVDASAPGIRRRRSAFAFTVILHLSALACIVLLHVHAPKPLPERPPIEVVMITPPVPLPEPVQAPRPVPPAAQPRPAVPPLAAPARPAQPAQAVPQSAEPPPAAAVPPAASVPAPAPQAVAPALDTTIRPAAPAGAVAPAVAPAALAAVARAPSLVPPSFDADYLHNPPPRYPPAAARLRESGRVLLAVAVSAAGLPERVEIAASSGSPRLDQAALETVKRWRFVPARQGDKPVAASVTVPLVFRLDE